MTTVGLAVAGLIAAGLTAAGPASAESARPSAVSAPASGPAHSLTAARKHAVIHRNSWHHNTLASHSQQNWYRLKLTSRSYVYTLLGALPADYNLRLYDDAGKVLSTSDHASLHAEKVARMLKAGTYFVRVASTHGSDAHATYALLVRVVPASETIGVLTAHVGSMGDAVGEIVNVSNETLEVAFMDVSFYASSGKLLHRYDHLSTVNFLWIPMAPGTRAPFDAVPGNVPQSVLNKATRVVVVPWWSSTPTRSAVSLTASDVRPTAHHRNGLTWVDYTGKLHNGSSRTVPFATTVVEARDSRGVLVGVAQDTHRIPAHATRKFRTTYENWRSKLTFSVHGFETVDD